MDIKPIILEYLPKIVHMSLATCRDNQPWVCEVHFVYDDELNLYFRSLTSRRHSQEIAKNPNVAGNIVRQHAVDEYPLGIYFEGSAELVQDQDIKERLAPMFKDRLKVASDILADAAKPDGHQFYKIAVHDWYVFGKLEEGKGGLKYHLPWGGSRRQEPK